MVEHESFPTEFGTYIFDMDGTIYQFDSPNGKYPNSSLNIRVNENTEKFIVARESCSLDQARTLRLSIPKEAYSTFLAERYGISRKDFFDIVWDIDPVGIVNDYQIPVQVLNSLYKNKKQLILVTGAAGIWQKRVCQFLGIESLFSRVYTAHDFKIKNEVFKELQSLLNPSNTISIGDQIESDIEPAIEYGFNAYQVKTPDDLNKYLLK